MKTPERIMKKYFEPKHQGARIMTTFQVDKELWTDFKILMTRENRPAGNAITEMIEKYVKEHKDGNPQYTMDQFEDPHFMATPAFYRDGTAWENYLRQADTTEIEQVKQQIIMIDHKLGKYL